MRVSISPTDKVAARPDSVPTGERNEAVIAYVAVAFCGAVVGFILGMVVGAVAF